MLSPGKDEITASMTEGCLLCELNMSSLYVGFQINSSVHITLKRWGMMVESVGRFLLKKKTFDSVASGFFRLDSTSECS